VLLEFDKSAWSETSVLESVRHSDGRRATHINSFGLRAVGDGHHCLLQEFYVEERFLTPSELSDLLSMSIGLLVLVLQNITDFETILYFEGPLYMVHETSSTNS
jgi:hypothetical protein